MAGRHVSLRVVPDELIVKFDPGTPKRVLNRILTRAGVTPESVVGRIGDLGVRVIHVTPAMRGCVLAALKSSGAVQYAEKDVVMTALDTVPDDPRWSAQWGPKRIGAPRAWDSTRGSSGVVIAVLDTGVDSHLADLSGRVLSGYDFVNNDSNPNDDQGHGTAVAGVLGAHTNNGEGQAGMCWTCSLLPVKVLDEHNDGTTSTIAEGIVWAVDHGARIINMSLGGPGTSQALTDAVAYAASKGVLMFAAAGNNGSTTPFYPAAYPQVVSVGGTDSSDRLYPWSDYVSWVQVTGPGCNVAPLRDGSYGDFCGTSSATPVVSGLAGLALAAKPNASVSDVYSAIRESAKAIGSSVEFGRVDAAGTLSKLGAAPVSSSSTSTIKGTLDPDPTSRSYKRDIGAGSLTLRLSFTGARTLTLELVKGETVARVSGPSPLRIARRVQRGTYRFVVKGSGTRASFTLVASYPKP
ncbi:MAG: peptidase S8 [Actinobacteria bacterium]|nr:MAG: peptidase S8 [Actinomycetota bacterium]